jgi:hypothetical protein
MSAARQLYLRASERMLGTVIAATIPAGNAADIHLEEDAGRPRGGHEIARADDDSSRLRCQAGTALPTKEGRQDVDTA